MVVAFTVVMVLAENFEGEMRLQYTLVADMR